MIKVVVVKSSGLELERLLNKGWRVVTVNGGNGSVLVFVLSKES